MSLQRLAVTVAKRRGLHTSVSLGRFESKGRKAASRDRDGRKWQGNNQHGHRPSGRPGLSEEANKALAERKKTMEEGLWKVIAEHEAVLEMLKNRPGGAFGRASKTRKRRLDDVLPGDFVEIRPSTSTVSANSNLGVVLPTPAEVTASGASQAIMVVNATGNVEVYRAPDVGLAFIDFVDYKLAHAAALSPETPTMASATQEVTEEPFDEARFKARAQICTRIRVLQRQAEAARQRLLPAFESLYLAENVLEGHGPTEQAQEQTLTTVEVAKRLLESSASSSVSDEAASPAILLATHQLLMSQPRLFISDTLSHRTTNLFLRRPEKDRRALRSVEAWVRDCQLHEGISSSSSSARAKEIVDGFCGRVLRAMEMGREGPSESSTKAPSNVDVTWTEEDEVIFDFLWATLGERRTLQGDYYSSLAMFLAKRCGLAEKKPPANHFEGEERPGSATISEVMGLSQTQAVVHDLLFKVGRLAPQQDLTTIETEFQILFPKDETEMSAQASTETAFATTTTTSTTTSSKVSLADFDGDRKREDLHCPIFVIDDPSAKELDDGIGIEGTADPDVAWVHIVIADPTASLGPHEDLALVARRKHSSVYLVNETYPLLPSPLVEPHGLGKGEKKALKFSAKLKISTAEVLDMDVGLVWLKDTRITSYDAVDQLLGSQASKDDEDVKSFRQIFDIACKLEERRRIVGGAFVAPYLRASARVSSDIPHPGDLERIQSGKGRFSTAKGYPEIDIVMPSLVEAGLGPKQTKSRGMVSEFMVLAGRLASIYAASNDVPVFFRAQDRPSAEQDVLRLEQMKDDEGVIGYRDLLASNVRISAASASDVPSEHFSMGINTQAERSYQTNDLLKGSGYVRATSPLRRYPDLVAHWQIKAALAGAKLPFNRETIRTEIPRIVRMDAWHRALERSSQRFWLTMKLARIFESEPQSPLLGPLDAIVTLPDVRIGTDMQARVRVQILETGLPVECVWGQREGAPIPGSALKVAVRDVAIQGVRGSVLVERV